MFQALGCVKQRLSVQLERYQYFTRVEGLCVDVLMDKRGLEDLVRLCSPRGYAAMARSFSQTIFTFGRRFVRVIFLARGAIIVVGSRK